MGRGRKRRFSAPIAGAGAVAVHRQRSPLCLARPAKHAALAHLQRPLLEITLWDILEHWVLGLTPLLTSSFLYTPTLFGGGVASGPTRRARGVVGTRVMGGQEYHSHMSQDNSPISPGPAWGQTSRTAYTGV